MPRAFTIERENLPEAVQGWLRAVGLGEDEVVELVFAEREILLRRPMSPELRAWAETTKDQYDRVFRSLTGI